jgi:ATP-dependent helicase/nuclease subunit A
LTDRDREPAGLENGAADASSPDERARAEAADPSRNVVLEASAGTGKTSVLVGRYLNLLRHGVDPANILAMTFTRKAAAEMRQRILDTLRTDARSSSGDAALWRELRDRAGDIAVGTIDAFCLSLLTEFPLEADLDPGFRMADAAEIAWLAEDALDRAIRVGRELARSDEDLRLVFAHLGEFRLREGLRAVLDHRLVAESALSSDLASGPRDLTGSVACVRAAERLRDVLQTVPAGLERFLADGPARNPRYALFTGAVGMVCGVQAGESEQEHPRAGRIRAAFGAIEEHFLTSEGAPRKKLAYRLDECASKDAGRRHGQQLVQIAPLVAEALDGFRRDLAVPMSRGVRRILAIAMTEYRRSLGARAALDFPELLIGALRLLGQMDEFARSRYRLESRYHHILVDEFQDTSRAQWTLISLLVRSWGEGLGLSAEAPLPPSIFIVGDRKQSIYGFRDADVGMLDRAGHAVARLRPDGDSRRAIARSFRAVPGLLAFTNDLFDEVAKGSAGPDAFRYEETDRFPVPGGEGDASEPLGIVAAASVPACAGAVAAEIERLLETGTVRDRRTLEYRPIRPGDIAVLFRSRDSHREFEQALLARKIPAYVYSGLGFFETEEIRDLVSLLRYLAEPGSSARAAAFLRSRLVRLSDVALQALAPDLTGAMASPGLPPAFAALDPEDQQILRQVRQSVARWQPLVDSMPPADLLERILADTAYAYEMRGRRAEPARENVKKLRALIRRVQNSGYATLGRIARHLDRLSMGDEANAVVDASGAVSLMTVHAAKGLEFPVVFLVNMSRGTGGARSSIRVGYDNERDEPWLSFGDFESEGDRRAPVRELEETKRLLYVAVTRARDRLYLVSEVKDGRFKPGLGSLARVLPASFTQVFELAARPATGTVSWSANGTSVHGFRVCPVPFEPPSALQTSVSGDAGPAAPAGDDFGPVEDEGAIRRVAATATPGVTGSAAGEPRQAAEPASSGSALAGELVHRLLRLGARAADGRASLDDAAALARELVREGEAASVNDLDEVARQAARAYLDLMSRPDVLADLASPEVWFEVPFSFRSAAGSELVRGRFDCLVRRPGGAVDVLEFKTGHPSESHQRQLDVYLAAARALFPGASVRGRLIYAGPPAAPDPAAGA